jgi:hypothetical protein
MSQLSHAKPVYLFFEKAFTTTWTIKVSERKELSESAACTTTASACGLR